MEKLPEMYQKWKPKQVKLMELLANPADHRTEAEKCQDVGVSVRTLGYWRQKSPDFNLAVWNMALCFLDKNLVHVLDHLYKQSEKGNHHASKILLELCSRYAPKMQIEANIKSATVNLTKEQLYELGESIRRETERGN